MKSANRLCAGIAGAAGLVVCIGLALGENGTTTGVVTRNNGTVVDVKVSTVEGKRTTTKQWTFQTGADTETTLGEEKLAPGLLKPTWKVTVNWSQAALANTNPNPVPAPKPNPNPVPVPKPKIGVVPVPNPVPNPNPIIKPVVNTNPMVADKIVVAVKSGAVVFGGFEGSDKVKIVMEDAGTPAKGKAAAAKRTKSVTANLFDNCRFFVDDEEVDRAKLAGREGQECKADVIDDGAAVPTIFRLTFRKAVEK